MNLYFNSTMMIFLIIAVTFNLIYLTLMNLNKLLGFAISPIFTV